MEAWNPWHGFQVGAHNFGIYILVIRNPHMAFGWLLLLLRCIPGRLGYPVACQVCAARISYKIIPIDSSLHKRIYTLNVNVIIFVLLQYWENGYPRLNLHKFRIWFSFLLLFRSVRVRSLTYVGWMRWNKTRPYVLVSQCTSVAIALHIRIFPISTDVHWTVILFLLHFNSVTFTFCIFCLASADGFIVIIMITNMYYLQSSIVEQTRNQKNNKSICPT